jgi:hypothetical protein
MALQTSWHLGRALSRGLGRGRFRVACATPFVELPVRLQTARRLRVECTDQCTHFIGSSYAVHGVRVLGCGVTENVRHSAVVVQIKVIAGF